MKLRFFAGFTVREAAQAPRDFHHDRRPILDLRPRLALSRARPGRRSRTEWRIHSENLEGEVG